MRVLFCAFVAFFVSCSPTYLIRNLPQNELAKKKLAVVPFVSTSINYYGDVKNEFGEGSTNVLIQNFLQKEIANGLKSSSCFGDVVFCPDLNRDDFELAAEVVSGSNVTFMRPIENSNSKMCGSDIALVIHKVELLSKTIVNVVYFVPIISRELTFKCSYSYWDLKNKVVLSCGEVNEESSTIGPILSMKDWNNLMENIVDELLVNDAYKRSINSY